MTDNRLSALRRAGELLEPIFRAEAIDRGLYAGLALPALTLQDNGGFEVRGYVGKAGQPEVVTATGDTLDVAFAKFLAARSVKLRELEQEAADREAFEEFKAQRVAA